LGGKSPQKNPPTQSRAGKKMVQRWVRAGSQDPKRGETRSGVATEKDVVPRRKRDWRRGEVVGWRSLERYTRHRGIPHRKENEENNGKGGEKRILVVEEPKREGAHAYLKRHRRTGKWHLSEKRGKKGLGLVRDKGDVKKDGKVGVQERRTTGFIWGGGEGARTGRGG